MKETCGNSLISILGSSLSIDSLKMSVPAVVPAAPTVLNLVNLKKRRLQLDEELKNVEKQVDWLDALVLLL